MKALRILKRHVRELPWRWHNAFRSFIIRRADLRCCLRTDIEPVFRDWADWSVFHDIFVEGDYDGAIKDMLAAAEAGRPLLILDIGANVGLFTLRCCHLRRLLRPEVSMHIHQFEACAATFRRLREQISRHNFPADTELIKSHFGAVGRRMGTIWIANNPFHAMTSANAGESGGREVSFLNLEDFVGPSPTIHLLKCDIEGGEKWLIEEYELLLRRTERAVFEFHLDRCDHGECLARLAQCGLQRQHVITANQYIALEYFTRAGSPRQIPGSPRLEPTAPR